MLPCVTGLIGAEAVAMSNTIIIQAVYIAIGPFFIVKASKGNAKGKKDGGASHLICSVLGSSAMHGPGCTVVGSQCERFNWFYSGEK
jgi:cohesin loading factor subunit SCC2